MLSTPWNQRQSTYDIVVIGSGYGGAITAARLATADLNPKPSICILERGKEWQPGEYPEKPLDVAGATRSDQNPLGLYELLNHQDISVIKGSGLGGTSLINANVAIVPDEEVFEQFNWPSAIQYRALLPYYQRAKAVLAANPHPDAMLLAKVQALNRRAAQIGTVVQPLDIVVNFTIDGPNQYGVQQKPCVNCGNCVTGCNVGAKNTLYMNYLPMAEKAGATILTQAKVEWLEKGPSGGWIIHGKYVKADGSEHFVMNAGEIVLSAGALNSTEILLRSEMLHRLSVSPALGTKFSGNGDFFGLTYSGQYETDVLGYDAAVMPSAGSSPSPGPNIVGVVRYNSGLSESKRIAIEDFSFPSASVDAAKAVFAAIQGQDTVSGNEADQRARLLRDLDPTNRQHDPNGAMNHSMLYLVMGHDNARGVILFDKPLLEPDGRIQVSWDQAGQQQIFTRMNEELRRHARALRGNFISNPTWSFFRLRHMITAHPLGGCPMGDDYLQGAVDSFGRVFAGDGSVHEGLYVTDGSIIPSALGVNPFLTISALTERFVERKIQQLQGHAYPAPAKIVSMSGISAFDASGYTEGQLESLFRRCPTMSIDTLVNQGGAPVIDIAERTIHNDCYWKGFFPSGNVLNAMSSAIFTGFKKEFHKQPNGQYTGVTSDTDNHVKARNSLEEVTLEVGHDNGTLEPGRYVLLRYLDPPWQGFYDIFKIINENLMIGRVYLGKYPHGARLFTFPMTRIYSFDQMTVDDHVALYASATSPTADDLNGVWRMDIISNANHAGGIAYLQFSNLPDGRFEARYQLMGLMEGLVVPSFVKDHFQLADFTLFHDEIRKVTNDFMVGKYVTAIPAAVAELVTNSSFGLFHTDAGGQFGFYYMLTRVAEKQLPTNTLLRPFLDTQLPDGIGMTFTEQMVGWYFSGEFTPAPGRDGDLTIGQRIPASGDPVGGVTNSFQVKMTIRDVNEFVDGFEHEAQLAGTITFGQFEGQGSATFPIDPQASQFHYLRIDPTTGEAEMNYHIEFLVGSRRFVLNGVKYMEKDVGDLLQDYTTLYCHVAEQQPDGSAKEAGTGLLRFKTFEDWSAVGNLAAFLGSFQIMGTSDPAIQFQARMRFLAFTAQFVQREFDPLGFGAQELAIDVRAEVARGAETPDYFSTRATSELQAILREMPTLGLDTLINKGAVEVDFDRERIFRDSFWKGSFAKDSLLGWEERVRDSLLSGGEQMGQIFAGGSFWKRFDLIQDAVAHGYVVNYELNALPGLPEVRQVAYPDGNCKYFKKGDPILLLNYTNDPYKIVYDTIKVIDNQNAIGVMHLGTFPTGIDFATFVMSRNSYPFDNMSVSDLDAMLTDTRTSTPAAKDLEGQWSGHLILTNNPDTSLLNQVSPVLFQVTFHAQNEKVEGQCQAGAIEFTSVMDPANLRRVSARSLIGKWAPSRDASEFASLVDLLKAPCNPLWLRFILDRAPVAGG